MNQSPDLTAPARSGEDPVRLPAEPLLVLERIRWSPFDLGEIWRHRELLFFMIWRDVKVRYKQTLFGAAWAVAQPLMSMVIFTIFFGRLARVPSEGVPYPIFAYAGLLPWSFFSATVSKGSGTLVSEARLISKVYFPRMILPATSVGAGLIDLAIALVVYFFLMVYYGVRIDSTFLLFPVLVALVSVLAFAVSMLLATWNVKYRDIRQVIPFLIQIWLFASPVIYPSTIVPEKYRWALLLNPMTGIIDGFRSTLFADRPVNWMSLAVSAVITVGLLLYSTYVFRRMERIFADII